MLIKCKECSGDVSDKALSCPHCGYPLKPEKQARARPKKRMKLPNGFGQISEIKGKNLRKPFRAMVTVGKTEHGRPISKLLKPESYFETYNQAYQALMEYHKNPYDISKEITLTELHDKWKSVYYKELKKTNMHEAAWKYCKPLYDTSVKSIKTITIKELIDNANTTANMKMAIRTVFNLMFDYAVEFEIADKNYARNLKINYITDRKALSVQKEHITYTDDEIKALLAYDSIVSDIIVYQCYSGWRPNEIFSLRRSDCDLKAKIIKGGMKTKSGTGRLVPIHSKVLDIVKKYYEISESNESEYLFTIDNRAVNYFEFRKLYISTLRLLGLNPNHRLHDGRKHFITLCKKYKVDEYAIKRIVGHSISDITEGIYTERSTDWLISEIEKIK